jgi:vancomycin resistance protein YoaR
MRAKKPKKATKRRRWWIPVAIVGILAAAYVGVSYYFAGRVPAGTSVAGVQIGSMNQERATSVLKEKLGNAAEKPIVVTVQDEETELDPKALGLTFSPEKTVDSVTGLSFNPVRVWNHIAGQGDIKPVVTVNRKALEGEIGVLAKTTEIQAVNGTVGVSTGEVVTEDPQDGAVVDVPAATTFVLDNWLVKPAPWKIPVKTSNPQIGPDQVAAAVKDIAEPVLSGPMSVTVDKATVDIPAAELAAAAVIEPVDGALALSFQQDLLAASVSSRLPTDMLTKAENAKFVFTDGKPQIQDGAPGKGVDGEALATEATTAAVAQGDARAVTVSLTETDPAAGRAELEKLGIKEVIGEFTTTATNNADRTKNLKKAAAIVTGMVVKPGETFSLNDALGHRSAETGWYSAGVVVAGQSTNGIGGGLSQFSTTLYNASHLAGMDDVEHQPHSNWFSRYPKGREATIWEGQIDNKFKNNTPYGVVLNAWVDSKLGVHVQLWSTHYWDVDAKIGTPTNYTSPRTIDKTGPGCKPQSAGGQGFTVSYTRTLSLNGEVKEKKTWTWTYEPVNAIVCKTPTPPPGG